MDPQKKDHPEPKAGHFPDPFSEKPKPFKTKKQQSKRIVIRDFICASIVVRKNILKNYNLKQ